MPSWGRFKHTLPGGAEREWRYDLSTLRGDLLGGITAAAVGLPGALAYGIASGLGAAAGLYGAITSGFFAAVFGGTRSQISCPTGPTAVAMAVIVTSYADSLTDAFLVVTLAGLLQIALGLGGLGRYVVYTPYSVRSGFMSGVGLILILVHILPSLGLVNPQGGVPTVLGALPAAIGHINFGSLAIALATLLVCVFWPDKFGRVISSIPVGLLAGTSLSIWWITDTPLIGELPSMGIALVNPQDIAGHLIQAFQPALVLALLASLNTLLISLAADSITRTSHNPNRELVGQGIGNFLCGLVGGVPGAGGGITVINARVGGRTMVAGMLFAAILLVALLGVGDIFERIPRAALAGLMIKVGWDLIDWRFILRFHRVQREHLVVMLVTLALSLTVDLLTSIAVGLILAGVVGARQLEYLELDSVISVPLLDSSFLDDQDVPDQVDPFSARVGLVAFKGIFTVASSNRMFATLSADIRDHEVVIVDLSHTVFMDNSAAFVLEDLIDVAFEEDTECIVLGMDGTIADSLGDLKLLSRIPEDRFVANMEGARSTARRILGL